MEGTYKMVYDLYKEGHEIFLKDEKAKLRIDVASYPTSIHYYARRKYLRPEKDFQYPGGENEKGNFDYLYCGDYFDLMASKELKNRLKLCHEMVQIIRCM